MNVLQSSSVASGEIARLAAERRFESIDPNTRLLVRQCILDLLGVTIAGATEPVVELMVQDASEEGGTPACSLIGRVGRVAPYQAAQINGVAGHALDYDDVHMTMEGHPSVVVLPALLALGEVRDASGAELITSFLSGYEASCHIGAFLGPAHYARGFHNTATVGAMAAAAGCARMLGLDAARTATALGIAATQAAGLKYMFGTMCKPLHAGNANRSGLFAARMSAMGMTSRSDVLEARQGFAEAHGSDRMSPISTGSWQFDAPFIGQNLFKYHAACYKTHSAIEAARAIAGNRKIIASDVSKVRLRVDRSLDTICNIQEPTDGLEAKFSLRHTTAQALAGVDTSRLDSYADETASNDALVQLRNRVVVELGDMDANVSEIEVTFVSGDTQHSTFNSSHPNIDLDDQNRRLQAKFLGLVAPVLGHGRAQAIVSLVESLDELPSVRILMKELSIAN